MNFDKQNLIFTLWINVNYKTFTKINQISDTLPLQLPSLLPLPRLEKKPLQLPLVYEGGVGLHAAGFVNEVFGIVDFLKLLLGSFLDVVSQRGNTVGMMLQGHLAISLFHLVVGG